VVLLPRTAEARLEPSDTDVPPDVHFIMRDPDAKDKPTDDSDPAWRVKDEWSLTDHPPESARWLFPKVGPAIWNSLFELIITIRPKCMLAPRRHDFVVGLE
jgi:hypothetical protein